jgi:hypothetical protein
VLRIERANKYWSDDDTGAAKKTTEVACKPARGKCTSSGTPCAVIKNTISFDS